MAVDPTSGVVVTVGQDKEINIFDTESGKLVRSFKQERDHGDLVKDKTSSEVFHDTLADESLQEKITSCRQALHGLNAAAAVFVQSMSELSTVSPRDRISGELRAQLIDEAALMIPEMSHKVNEIVAKVMLEHKNRTSDRIVST